MANEVTETDADRGAAHSPSGGPKVIGAAGGSFTAIFDHIAETYTHHFGPLKFEHEMLRSVLNNGSRTANFALFVTTFPLAFVAILPILLSVFVLAACCLPFLALCLSTFVILKVSVLLSGLKKSSSPEASLVLLYVSILFPAGGLFVFVLSLVSFVTFWVTSLLFSPFPVFCFVTVAVSIATGCLGAVVHFVNYLFHNGSEKNKKI